MTRMIDAFHKVTPRQSSFAQWKIEDFLTPISISSLEAVGVVQTLVKTQQLRHQIDSEIVSSDSLQSQLDQLDLYAAIGATMLGFLMAEEIEALRSVLSPEVQQELALRERTLQVHPAVIRQELSHHLAHDSVLTSYHSKFALWNGSWEAWNKG